MANLDKFEPLTDLPPDFFLIVYGMRRSGKTTMLMHMLEEMKTRFEKHKAFVFCGTGCDNQSPRSSRSREKISMKK
jgi:predicted AAA+ superfamily ATPase